MHIANLKSIHVGFFSGLSHNLGKKTLCRLRYCLIEPSLASALSMYLEKKNLKRQTGKSGFMKAEKYVAARLTQTWAGEKVCADLRPAPPTFMLPLVTCFKTTGHHCVHVSITCGSVHTRVCRRLSVCHMAEVYKQSVSRYWTPELFWPPLPMHTILVSGLHVEVCKPRSPGHIPPALWHSAPGFK